MRKKIKIIIISMFIFFFINVTTVSADASISREEILIDGLRVYELYDNVAEGAEKQNVSQASAGTLTLTIDGVKYISYCVEFGVDIKSGNETKQNLLEYFKNALSEEAAKKLVNKIALYTHYGYGYSSRTTTKYYLATQQLIWQAISDSGFYASNFYADRVLEVETISPRVKTKIDNFKWVTKASASDTNVVAYIDVSNELKEIQNSVHNYYLTPSFCTNQSKLEIEVGETAKFNDNNGVLSQYTVTCDEGLECQTEGNKLTVTAVGDSSKNSINFNKKQSGTEIYLYRGVKGDLEYQGIIPNNGIVEGISCSFGIESYKNVQTSDTKIAYVAIIGLFSGIIAYIAYYTKKSIDQLN